MCVYFVLSPKYSIYFIFCFGKLNNTCHVQIYQISMKKLMAKCVFYRPQRSWGNVMFFTLVCDSVHRVGGVGWYPSMHCRWYPSIPCRFPGPHPAGEVEGSGRGGGGRKVSRPIPKGEAEGSGLGGVSRPTPRGGGKLRVWPGGGLQAHTQGGS